MTRDEVVQVVRGLLDDGHRIDRYLRQTDEGSYYTTDAERYCGDDHSRQDHYERVPWIDGGTDLTEEEYEAEAEAIVQRLDDEIEDCDEC